MNRLEAALREAGISELLASQLSIFGELVLSANRRFNLSGAKSEEQILPHLLDSLTVAPFVAAPYVDVGSGAGFPALPAMLASGVSGTLVEANRKKAAFLQSAALQLGVACETVVERAETAARSESLREQFASGTARAVATAPAAAELLLPFIRVGGLAIFQQGALDEAERRSLEDSVLVLGGRIAEQRLLAGERRLIVVRKERPTPHRFPRRTGIPQKRPLCST